VRKNAEGQEVGGGGEGKLERGANAGGGRHERNLKGKMMKRDAGNGLIGRIIH
jgi:hypothetical protein